MLNAFPIKNPRPIRWGEGLRERGFVVSDIISRVFDCNNVIVLVLVIACSVVAEAITRTITITTIRKCVSGELRFWSVLTAVLTMGDAEG